ncbi:hypothetical protein M5Y95_13980, partial [Staphylococcus aureus]|nr:hypothetical protein [Staphylococcus aureus]
KVFCLRFFQTVSEIMVYSGRLVILVIGVTGIANPTHSRDASPVYKSFEPAQVVGEVTFSFLDAAMVLFQGNSVLSFGFEFSCASVLQFSVLLPDDFFAQVLFIAFDGVAVIYRIFDYLGSGAILCSLCSAGSDDVFDRKEFHQLGCGCEYAA